MPADALHNDKASNKQVVMCFIVICVLIGGLFLF